MKNEEIFGSIVGKELDQNNIPIPLTDENQFKVKDKVFVYCGGKYMEMTLNKNEDGWYAENNDVIATLDFAEDSRHCLTSALILSKKGLAEFSEDLRKIYEETQNET